MDLCIFLSCTLDYSGTRGLSCILVDNLVEIPCNLAHKCKRDYRLHHDRVKTDRRVLVHKDFAELMVMLGLKIM